MLAISITLLSCYNLLPTPFDHQYIFGEQALNMHSFYFYSDQSNTKSLVYKAIVFMYPHYFVSLSGTFKLILGNMRFFFTII